MCGVAGLHHQFCFLHIHEHLHSRLYMDLQSHNTLIITTIIYSKILLIRLAWDWTGAKLSNIPDYHMVPILTWVVIRNFVLLLLYLGCTTNQRSILFGYLSSAGSGSSGSSYVFAGVFIAGEVGVGHKGSGDTTTVDVQTFLKAFFDMFLRSACFIDAAFFW